MWVKLRSQGLGNLIIQICSVSIQGADLQNNESLLSSPLISHFIDSWILSILPPHWWFFFSCWTILFGPIGREKQNCSFFLLVEIKILIKKTKNILDEILDSLFYCFVNPFPGVYHNMNFLVYLLALVQFIIVYFIECVEEHKSFLMNILYFFFYLHKRESI